MAPTAPIVCACAQSEKGVFRVSRIADAASRPRRLLYTAPALAKAVVLSLGFRIPSGRWFLHLLPYLFGVSSVLVFGFLLLFFPRSFFCWVLGVQDHQMEPVYQSYFQLKVIVAQDQLGDQDEKVPEL